MTRAKIRRALPDGWEVLYSFDPNNDTGEDGRWGDPDNDGLSNLEEYLNATNPRKADTDGDGVADGTEVEQGGNANNATDGGVAPPEDEIKEVSFKIYGDFASWEMTVEGKGPDDSRLQKITTEEPGGSKIKILKLRKGNKYEVTMKYVATLKGQDKEWFCWEAQIDSNPDQQTFQSYSNTRFSDVPEFFTVGDGGWLVDNREGLLTKHVHSMAGSAGNIAGTKKAFLLPVEIVQPKLDANGDATAEWEEPDEVRICRFRDAFNSPSYFKSDFIDYDRDRFKVRIPGLDLSQAKIKIKLGVNAIDGSEIDNPTEIELTKTADGYESESMILVIDDYDDGFNPGSEFGIGDDQLNDRTHVVELNSTIELEFVDFANGSTMSKDVLKTKKVVNINVVPIISSGSIWYDGLGWDAKVKKDLRVMAKIYSAIGIRFIWGIDVKTATSQVESYWANDGDLDYAFNHSIQPWIRNDFVDPYGSGYPIAETITVYYIPAKLQQNFSDGSSEYVHGFNFTGNIFIALDDSDNGTLAHEVGHALGISGKPHPYATDEKHLLMKRAPDYFLDFKIDSKRITKSDETKMIGSKYAN